MSTELEELRTRLQEAEETLRAIREGRVDALVVHEAEEEKVYTLASADRPYRIMVEEMGQGAVTLAADGTILYCNRCFAAILGTPLEEVLGAAAPAFVAPASRAAFEALLEQGLADGSGQGEVTLTAAGGNPVPAYVAATILSPEEGAALCLIVTDLTEHKAGVEAAAANRAKDRFLATLSHELRTPLTPVLAVVSSLTGDERLPDEVRGQLAMMRRNLELEARLIDDMLDLTRVAQGKLELRRGTVEPRQVLDHALQTVAQDLEAKRLRLATDLRAEDLRLWADAPRITQVFWNLLHNATKFTPDDGTIAVRSWREGSEGYGGWLIVEVSDTGRGIEADVLEHIFEAFDQGQSDTTRRFGGLGLGLAISKAIVEMHGGTLTAASPGRDQGATFTVRLPLPSRTLPAPAAEPETMAPAAEAGPSTRPLHLLLVEDHADTAEAMADLLRALGYDVTVAGSVTAGRAAAEASRRTGSGIDLVVSDLGLPDGSGLELMRELSSRHGLRGIALSGYGMEEDLRNSREAGFERHLTKPVSLQDLESALRELSAVIAGGPLPPPG